MITMLFWALISVCSAAVIYAFIDYFFGMVEMSIRLHNHDLKRALKSRNKMINQLFKSIQSR